MSEALKFWLRSRLGVIVDLSPEVFGHHAKDGTLLAKLLYSYDIINDGQLQLITPTQEPAVSRVNLRSLKVWLHFIGVECDDDCIRKISEGRGIATLRLFHKVYLSLENKDRLHFITFQREREKFIPTSTKFHVEVVPEDVKQQEKLSPFIEGLLMERYRLLKWYGIQFGSTSKRKVKVRFHGDADI